MPMKAVGDRGWSIGSARRLVWDILAVPEFQDAEFAYTDMNESNPRMVTQPVFCDIKESRLPATTDATLERRRALKGAGYVFSSVPVGGLEAFEKDTDIPLRRGTNECVGDTLCPGGTMYAQRGIPVLPDFCNGIREAAAPGASSLKHSKGPQP